MRGRRLLAATTLALVAGVATAATASDPAPRLVDRSLLLGFLADPSTLTLIDARSPAEYAARHVAGAVNVPADQLDSYRHALPASRSAPIVVYCATGQRASRLREALADLGYQDVRVLPRRQLFWTDTIMVFNCGVEDAAPVAAGTAGRATARAVPAPRFKAQQPNQR